MGRTRPRSMPASNGAHECQGLGRNATIHDMECGTPDTEAAEMVSLSGSDGAGSLGHVVDLCRGLPVGPGPCALGSTTTPEHRDGSAQPASGNHSWLREEVPGWDLNLSQQRLI